MLDDGADGDDGSNSLEKHDNDQGVMSSGDGGMGGSAGLETYMGKGWKDGGRERSTHGERGRLRQTRACTWHATGILLIAEPQVRTAYPMCARVVRVGLGMHGL